MAHEIAFTGREDCATLDPAMPRLTVSQRLRGTLRKWIEREGRGTAAAIAYFSQTRPQPPDHPPINAQDLTYFLRNTPGRVHPIGFDDLDDIAAYFRVSVGELFELKAKDLSGPEQRLIWGFRGLPEVTREHFLALIDAASVSATVSAKNRLRPSRSHHITTAAYPSVDVTAIDSSLPAPESADLQERWLTLSADVAAFLAGANLDRLAPNPDAGKPDRGKTGS